MGSFKRSILLAAGLLALVALAAGPDTALTLAVIGDYGSGQAQETAVANRVHTWDVDAVITLGDNNYPSGAASTIARNITRDYGRYISGNLAANRFWPSLGNHDYKTRQAQSYIDYFVLPGNERWYSVDYGVARLWALDSSKWGAEQRAWLEAGLAGSEACFDIVYFHHAPYSSGKHGGTAKMRLPFGVWGAEVVMAGHDHTYERLDVGGVPYFVNGLGGKSRYPWGGPPLTGAAVTQARFRDDYGAMRLTVDGNTLTAEFITDDGVIVDTLTIAGNCSY